MGEAFGDLAVWSDAYDDGRVEPATTSADRSAVSRLVTNAGYHAVGHPEIVRLDAALADLEEAAGGWPLYADDDGR